MINIGPMRALTHTDRPKALSMQPSKRAFNVHNTRIRRSRVLGMGMDDGFCVDMKSGVSRHVMFSF